MKSFLQNYSLRNSCYKCQFKLFEKNNVNLEKVVIGHCTSACDIGYLKSILKSGCFIGFDRIYYLDYAEQARIIAELIAMGYEDKLLVSHDFFAYYDYADDDLQVQEKWGRDFTAVHKLLLPKLKSLGINERTIKKLTIGNPKKLLVSN